MTASDFTGFVVIGAGPAGLAAAHELARRGLPCVVFEQDTQVGGLSKTVEHHGFRCDIGGHRFFTKNSEVNQLWEKTLPEDFLTRPRLSRIFYRGRFFYYPLRPLNALFGLGVVDSTRVLASFAARRLFPKHPEASFEDWVANRFGQRLYEIFFKTYTEKVWGVPCTALSADWAAQRIRNLSLGRALLDALKIRRKGTVASLIEEFRYPRFGPGQMYNALAQEAERLGATVCLRHEAAQIRHAGSRITHIILTSDLRSHEVAAGNLISSMPITDLVLRLKPEPPAEVLLAARCLRYRSIITVNLIVDVPAVLPDTWVYLHSPEVRAGRMQLYKNWSPAMVPDSSKSIIGFEYFCREGDELWNAPETALHEIAKSDLCTLRLVDPAMILESFVARYPKAYPVYDDGYRTHLDIIRRYLGCFKNLVCVGRYGQFRYNNMDHSIITGLLGVRRLLGEPVDPWAVNEDAEYHEELGRRASTAGA